MCNCASCEYTDSFSGWRIERARDGSLIPDNSGGFADWPRGNPAGRTSAKDYAAHVSAGKSVPDSEKLPDYYRTVPKGAVYPRISDLVGPIPQAPKVVLDYIASGYKSKGPELTGPVARPETPAKAPQHLPELDRQREPSIIYTMPKPKARPVGRPPIAKGGAVRVLVTLDQETIDKARKLGGDKLSPGLREAVRRVKVA